MSATVVVHEHLEIELVSLLQFLKNFPTGTNTNPRLYLKATNEDTWNITVYSGESVIADLCYKKGLHKAYVLLRRHRISDVCNFLVNCDLEDFTFHLYPLPYFVY